MPHSPPRLSTLILLSALAVLPLNTILPSLPAIAATFGIEYGVANIAVAGYAVVGALTQLLAGRLSDRFGRRPVVLVALVVFVVASIGCATATRIESFLAWRALQAVVAAVYAVSLAIVQDSAGTADSTRVIGQVATAWAFAPMLGPTLGGLVDQSFGWRATFVLLALVGLAALALAARDLRGAAKRAAGPPVPFLVAYRTLLGSPLFVAVTACMVCSIGAFYVYIGGVPLVATPLLGGSTVLLGVWMGVVPAGFVVGNFLSSRAAIAAKPMRNIVLGRLVTCASLAVGVALAWAGVLHPAALFVPCIAIGLGNGLTLPAANARVLTVRPGLAGTAAGLAAATTQAGAAAISATVGFLLPAEGSGPVLMGALLAVSIAALAAGWQASRLVARSTGA